MNVRPPRDRPSQLMEFSSPINLTYFGDILWISAISRLDTGIKPFLLTSIARRRPRNGGRAANPEETFHGIDRGWRPVSRRQPLPGRRAGGRLFRPQLRGVRHRPLRLVRGY